MPAVPLAAPPPPDSSPCPPRLQRLHAEEGVPFEEIAVLLRAFNWSGGKTYVGLQASHGGGP